MRAPVAQWIEHRSSEPRVVGSNPSGRTTFQIQNEAPGLFRGPLCFGFANILLTGQYQGTTGGCGVH